MHISNSEAESRQAVNETMDVLRATLKQLPDGENQLLVLYDLEGAGYRNFDMTFSREMIARFDKEFPNAVEKVLVFNGRKSIMYAWSAISMLLAPEGREK